MTTAAAEDREAAQVQLASADPEALATTEEEVKTGLIELKGEKFHVAEFIGAMPMLKWARAAELDTDDPAALSAIFLMLEDCIHEDDWRRFDNHACKSKASAEELLTVINKAMELIAGTPTEQSGGSSAGDTGTSGESKAVSSRKARSRSAS